MRKFLAVAWMLACGGTVALGGLHVDFTTTYGKIKPVSAVGQPPLLAYDNMSMFHYLTEAGVEYSRLHDMGGAFGKNIFVDIPNVFRDFEADENDPKNYDFAFTDVLLKGMVAAGLKPFYRLGVTIENAAARVKAYRVVPPKDYAKWARICEHVIAHYNEGWANGFHYGIEHWEIWNEPDDHIYDNLSFMWRAPFSEYIKLYGVAATHLKKCFPDIKICAFGCCGFYGVNNPNWLGEKNRAQVMNFITCATNFLAAVKREGWPLDMFTFHAYETPRRLGAQIEWIRKTLDDYGFEKTEINLDEWLVDVAMDQLGTSAQASEVAAALTIFQNGPLDMAMIYDARCGASPYSPLFNPLTQRPYKAYWSLYAFNELKKLGSAAKVSGEVPKDVWIAGATDCRSKGVVLIANTAQTEQKVDLKVTDGWAVESTMLIDRYYDYCPHVFDNRLPPQSVMLLKFTLGDPSK